MARAAPDTVSNNWRERLARLEASSGGPLYLALSGRPKWLQKWPARNMPLSRPVTIGPERLACLALLAGLDEGRAALLGSGLSASKSAAWGELGRRRRPSGGATVVLGRPLSLCAPTGRRLAFVSHKKGI